jgi:glycosyltransferase involved in cell wall biosynthesis
MKVTFLSPVGGLGGAERTLIDLLRWLRPTQGLELSVLTLERGPLTKAIQELQIGIKELPLPRALAAIGEGSFKLGGIPNVLAALATAPLWVARLRRMLRDEAPSIVHSNGLKAHILASLTCPPGSRVVWHLHDFVSERPVTRRLLPRLQGRTELAIAVSSSVAEDARRLLPRLRVVPILNGVDVDFFRASPAALDLDELARLPGSARAPVRVGLVATYAYWKGHEVFLAAAQRLRDSGARFYVVGGPVYSTPRSQTSASQLRQWIRSHGLDDTCGLVPFQSDSASVYSSLDIVVHASTKPEPFGRTVAEAMAAGKAVVATSTGGVLEQIEHGETGLLVAPGNDLELASTLRTLIADAPLRTRLGQAAQAFAATHLSAQRFALEILREYSAQAGSQAPPRLQSQRDAAR